MNKHFEIRTELGVFIEDYLAPDAVTALSELRPVMLTLGAQYAVAEPIEAL